jgi:aspartate kinase
MQVFKFGGASIKDASAIQNIAEIVKQKYQPPMLIVISASGKTTNALERVLDAYWHQNQALIQTTFASVKAHHQAIVQDLFPPNHPVLDELHDIFIDLEWILEETPQDSYDYLYDQIVSTGEMLSTLIVAQYFTEIGIKNTWVDVRDCIRTDNNYRDARVDWDETMHAIQSKIPELTASNMVITQGFLGGTSENFTTTLGREGSDFTAAIFSYCLDAQSMTIWKDVPGVLTADPRIFDKPPLIEKLSYLEALEMTYYGAQVIHPKTIRPLQNKSIPLNVKSFIHPNKVGTLVKDYSDLDYLPMVVVKNNQALLKIVSNDFYFVDESKFSTLFALLAKHRIRVNMTQNTALAFSVCVNNDAEKIEALTAELATSYTIETIDQLKLITIRHSQEDLFQKIRAVKKIYLEEKIRSNIQLLMHQDEVL